MKQNVLKSVALAAMLLTGLVLRAQDKPVTLPPVDPKTAGTIGLKIENIKDKHVKPFPWTKGVTGVVVMEVVAGTTGEKSGFKAGDVLTRINGKRVTTVQAFMDERLRFKVGDVLELGGTHDGKTFMRKVKVQAVG